MNTEQAELIISHIRANNSADLSPSDFMPFKTSTAIGHIPRQLVGFFAEVSGFKMSNNGLIFNNHCANNFDTKTKAVRSILDKMVGHSAIKSRIDSWGYEGRYVGGKKRLTNPELEVDRQYFQYFGFEADAAFLEIRTQIDGQDYILLQRRSADVIKEGTYSFTASGATKKPATSNRQAALDQINHEIDPLYNDLANKAIETAHTLRVKNQMKYSPNGSLIPTILNIRTQLYSVAVSPEIAINISNLNTKEASGYDLATPEQIIQYCLDGTIDPMLTQSYIASMIATKLMPNSEFLPQIKDALEEKNGCVFAKKPSRSRPSLRPQ